MKRNRAARVSRSIFVCRCYENRLEELETKCHHEQALFGVVNVTEIESLTESGVIQVLKHLAETKVVIDVKGDEIQQVNTESSLKTPSNALGVEILVSSSVFQLSLLTVNGIGLVKQSL